MKESLELTQSLRYSGAFTELTNVVKLIGILQMQETQLQVDPRNNNAYLAQDETAKDKLAQLNKV